MESPPRLDADRRTRGSAPPVRQRAIDRRGGESPVDAVADGVATTLEVRPTRTGAGCR